MNFFSRTFFVFCCIAFQGLAHSEVVGRHGNLRVQGRHIVDKSDQPVSLAGMSLFWSQWKGEFYNRETVAWLKEDWKASVMRIAVGITDDGYLGKPDVEMKKVRSVVEAAIAEDIYVIIDWHDHHAEDHTAQAVKFFSEVSRDYGQHPNVIYEVYNEPLDVSWSQTIKPYAEKVIATIRENDPDNLIVVGTPRWSQRVDLAAADPIRDVNVAYSLHFYAGTHKDELRSTASVALEAGIPLFVTEWGTVNANGDGAVDRSSMKEWTRFLKDNKLCHLNWSICDKAEGASVLRPGSSTIGGWADSDLTDSGRFVRTLVRQWGH